MAMVLDNLYVTNGSISDLMDKFTEKYREHQHKKVIIYGDVNGNVKRGPEHQFTSLYEEVESALSSAGWSHYRPYTPFNPPHSEKNLLINKALEEKTAYNLPHIRIYEGCKALLASIMGAGMKENFEKDKRTEHPNNPTKAEESTHLSDAFDYWYYPKYCDGFIVAGSGGSMEITIG